MFCICSQVELEDDGLLYLFVCILTECLYSQVELEDSDDEEGASLMGSLYLYVSLTVYLYLCH